MISPRDELAQEYASAFREYLAGAGEAALKRAYELGRRAVAEGLGVLEMAALHHEALAPLLGEVDGSRAIKAAESVLMEGLSPFEMTHRGYRDANLALRRLNEKLEEETKRIAHELHDEAGQLLACVHIALADVARELPGARQRLEEVQGMLDRIEEQLRRLSHELRPTILDDLGLLPALEFLADGVSGRAKIPVTVEGSTRGRLSPAVETALYRVAQEALTNATKHASPTHLWIRLEHEERLIRCVVQDDGVGFDVGAVLGGKNGERGLGLIGMKDRVGAVGGRLEIISGPGNGTTLLVEIPLGK